MRLTSGEPLRSGMMASWQRWKGVMRVRDELGFYIVLRVRLRCGDLTRERERERGRLRDLEGGVLNANIPIPVSSRTLFRQWKTKAGLSVGHASGRRIRKRGADRTGCEIMGQKRDHLQHLLPRVAQDKAFSRIVCGRPISIRCVGGRKREWDLDVVSGVVGGG